ncbi:YbaB/EbfC family nucleoid-associated protein [Micromonospora sp. NPDC049679]|uniref:YbaB/EbfC family nucleoid-associated protein n=1 Tax=Micromonospora sp. NPDC049679 TaxID=3155920 RepID=UPI0033EE7241
MAQAADRDANRALRARFDEVYGQYERLRSGLDDLQQRLAKLRVSARSEDGHVTATVGPRGQLVALELDPRIYRDHNVDALAAKITSTIQQATDRATAAVQELVGGYLPAGSGAADYLKDGNFGSLLRRTDAAMREEAERDD